MSKIQDENRALKKQLEQQRKIMRHEDGNYVTLADDSPEIQYCSTCNNWLKARNGGN